MKGKELSGFCMQIALLLDSGVPLESGLSVMAEDAERERDRKLLLQMSEEVELGELLDTVMEKTGEFPPYLVKMAGIGHKTGNLEKVMRSMSNYYAKEYSISKNIRNAVSYPLMMVAMLMIVLFVLLTKVMPIFEQVYNQLGTETSQFTKQVISAGTIFSGAAIIVLAIMAVAVVVVSLRKTNSDNSSWAEKLLEVIKERSSLSKAVVKRRILAVMAISEASGLKPEEGIKFAETLVSEKYAKLLEECAFKLETGENSYEALKDTGLFTGMDLQMIKVGNRAGKSEMIFSALSDRYEENIDEAIDLFIGRFEPSIVIVLALIVGLILVSVMLPLINIMTTIGM